MKLMGCDNMKIFTNILSIIQSVALLAGIITSIILAHYSMLAVVSLWIANIMVTILSIILLALSKNTFSKIYLVNNIAIVFAVIVNFIYAHIINYSYVISFAGMPDWFYCVVLAACLIINLLCIAFYIRKQRK